MPNPIRVECPHCFSTFKLKSSASIGKNARCPNCSDPFVVEEMATAVVDDIYHGAEMADDDYGAAPAMPQPLPGPTRKKLKKKKQPQIYGENADYQTYVSPSEASRSISAGVVAPPKQDLGIFFWLLGGMIGGAIGTVIWLAVLLLTGFESGWVAWGIGGLVGLGVRIPARGSEGAGPGLTAATIAICSILTAKMIIVFLVALLDPEETLFSAMVMVFSFWDLLWFPLAGWTAYKVGSSVEDD